MAIYISKCFLLISHKNAQRFLKLCKISYRHIIIYSIWKCVANLVCIIILMKTEGFWMMWNVVQNIFLSYYNLGHFISEPNYIHTYVQKNHQTNKETGWCTDFYFLGFSEFLNKSVSFKKLIIFFIGYFHWKVLYVIISKTKF